MSRNLKSYTNLKTLLVVLVLCVVKIVGVSKRTHQGNISVWKEKRLKTVDD